MLGGFLFRRQRALRLARFAPHRRLPNVAVVSAFCFVYNLIMGALLSMSLVICDAERSERASVGSASSDVGAIEIFFFASPLLLCVR